MTPTQATGATAATSAPAARSAAASLGGGRSSISDTYDNFLKLLTTQLQYQDPLSPMESTEWTQQLVSFSQVEQQLKQTDLLEKLVGSQNAQGAQTALGYIGLDVTVEGRTIPWPGSGSVTLGYTLPSDAKQAKLAILNEQGQVVRTLQASAQPGARSVTWDGRDDDGRTLPAGRYQFAVGATDQAGKALTIPTTVTGRVTGIERDQTGLRLMLGPVPVGLESVRSARVPTDA